MTLVRLQRLRLIADAAQERVAAQRRRVRMVSTNEVAAPLRRQAMFPVLVAWWADMADAMRSRWPEAGAPPPVFPAFG